MKRKVIMLISLIVVVGLIGSVIIRPSIHQATVDDLQCINGIGETLSYRIVEYTSEHKNCTVDDIIDVQGIGKKKLFKIKLRYGD